MVAPGGGVRGFFDEIRSMSGRYASYWNAFLFTVKSSTSLNIAHANTLSTDSYLKTTTPSKNVVYFISLKANFLPV